MTFRPKRHHFALALALAALPALAGKGDDPLATAQAAIDRGDGVSAEVAARRALDNGAPREAVAAYMGQAYVLQGNEGEAMRWLGPGEFDARSAEMGLRTLGRIQTERGNYAAAAEAFDRVHIAGQESSGLWVDIARMRYFGGEQHIVGQAISRALALDPKNPAALSMQAQLLRDARGLAASLPWFERAIELTPGNVVLLGEYAATLGELGRYKSMLDVVRQMHKIDSSFPQIYFLQAVLAARAGKDDLARRLLWRAGKEMTSTPAGRVLEGVLAYRSGHPSLAVEKFDEVARGQPDNTRVALMLARALISAGDLPEAVARLQPLAARSDASPYLLTLLARAYEQLGRRDLAAPLLDRAAGPPPTGIAIVPAEPGRSDAAAAQLRLLLAGGQASEAMGYAAELVRRFPGAADIEILVGDAALLTGDPVAALASYTRAAQVRRTTSLAMRMGYALHSTGQPKAASDLLAEAFRQSPQDASLAMQMGRLAMLQGNRAQAVGYWQQAVRLGRVRDANLLVELAQAQLELGQVEAALANARQAYALQRSNMRATAVLASAMTAQGVSGGQTLQAKARRIAPAPALAIR